MGNSSLILEGTNFVLNSINKRYGLIKNIMEESYE